MKEFVELYKRVIDFNTSAGIRDAEPFTNEWWKSVELQTKLLVEESQEAYDGAVYGNAKELLDGCVDNLVIAFKFADMLQKAGFDVVGAFEAICTNNDSKVFDSFYEAAEEKEELELRDDVEYWIDTAICHGVPKYSIKRLDGKVMKKVGFQSVDLSKFLPKGE